MGSETLIQYSPSNIYARKYYDAYNEFDKARKKVIAYEQQSDDRQSKVYHELMSQFLYWDAKVPELSQIAGKEEEKIAAKRKQQQQENLLTSSPFHKNDKLDFMA